jgi:hypothetical protein
MRKEKRDVKIRSYPQGEVCLKVECSHTCSRIKRCESIEELKINRVQEVWTPIEKVGVHDGEPA